MKTEINNEYHTEYYKKYYTNIVDNEGLTIAEVNAALEAFEKALDIAFQNSEDALGFDLKGFTPQCAHIENFDFSIERQIVDGQIQYWGIFTGEDDKAFYLQGWIRNNNND